MRSVIMSAGCALVVVGLLAGCVSGDPKNPGTVTVTVPPGPAARPGSSTASTASSSATPTPSATPTTLAGTCDSLLADYTVSNALGGLDLGRTAFVVGVPDRAIGRLSTINCRYRVTGTAAATTAGIEIGVSLYRTPEQAEQRITATVDDYVGRGATRADATVGTDPAVTGTVLSGAQGDGYDLPLLVLATDRRTVAVTVDPATVTTPPADEAAATLAALAVDRTAP